MSKQRANRGVPGTIEEFNDSGLKSEADILTVAISQSSKTNERKAVTLFSKVNENLKNGEPTVVTAQTSKLLINIIAQYCNTGKETALSEDTMGGLIQGFRTMFEKSGHRGTWSVDPMSGRASGNPLIGNDDIKKLRVTHRVHLSQIDRIKIRARPLPISLVAEHANVFWFGCGKDINYKDVLLHTIMLVGLNCGLRYDEVHKLKISHVTINSGELDTGSIILTITERIKNSTVGRQYILRKWPGNTEIRNSIILCPFTAVLSWLNIRGNREGYLFCDISNKNLLKTDRPWQVKEFTKFLRDRLRMCGVGKDDVLLYSGHSLKRGCIQLWRSLGLRDEQIMEIVQMCGTNAYANYCEVFNDCAPNDIPRFTNLQDMINHVETIKGEQS